jgi:hypothetical protein
MNGSLYATLLYLVSCQQDGLHYSALGTGIRLIVITGAATAVTIPVGRVSAHVPARWLIGPGLGLLGPGKRRNGAPARCSGPHDRSGLKASRSVSASSCGSATAGK